MSMVLLSFLKRYWNYPGKLFPRHCQEINLSAVAACGSIALFLIGRYNPVSFPLLWYLVIISESAAAVMWIVCFHFLLGWGFAEFWDHGEGGNVLRAGWFWWVSCVYQRGVVFLSSCYYFCLFSIISEGNHLAFSSASVSSKRILRHRKTCFRSQRNPVVHLLAAATRCSPCSEELAERLRALLSIFPWDAWTKGCWGVLHEPFVYFITVPVCLTGWRQTNPYFFGWRSPQSRLQPRWHYLRCTSIHVRHLREVDCWACWTQPRWILPFSRSPVVLHS